MKLRNLIIAAAALAIASPALATVKVYDGTADNGTVGDVLQYSSTLCPPIQSTAGGVQGYNKLTDTGGGSVTLSTEVVALTEVDYGTAALTGIFGPGSFVFVNSRNTWTTIAPAVGTGETNEPGSGMGMKTVTWGVIAGWNTTGTAFCIASPQTICTGGSMTPHGETVPSAPPNSPTYDLGTWSFDAAGDLVASQYITGTHNGGTSNRQRLIRGAYVGSSIPALPLLGAGALALGLAVAGTRSVMRKK